MLRKNISYTNIGYDEVAGGVDQPMTVASIDMEYDDAIAICCK